ncbi:GDP-mannose 4,6-dehydratase [Fodinicurvata sp. EGI_FJ10296]|uniref:GDP-mannose 4,6-dehydratase n=1 Tax=Fodinicurvata sp. EGI_FJ10296 TaxID=3231908 RepID=UPI003451C040
MKRILITGTAGFIGFHLTRLLLAEGCIVLGYDGLTDYYDVGLKRRSHQMLLQNPRFSASEGMLEDQRQLDRVADDVRPDGIGYLAAQAGVRYSLDNPRAYLSSNVIGTFNVMDVGGGQTLRFFAL